MIETWVGCYVVKKLKELNYKNVTIIIDYLVTFKLAITWTCQELHYHNITVICQIWFIWVLNHYISIFFAS